MRRWVIWGVLGAVAVIGGLVLGVVIGGRSGGSALADPGAVSVIGSDGDPVSGLTVEVAPSDAVFDESGVVVAYDISVDGNERGPFELRLPATGNDPASELIARWEAELEMWVPVETRVDGTDLVAEVDSFSLWAAVSSWAQYRLGLITGTRATKPTCTGGPPAWADQVITVDDDNAELFACGEVDRFGRLVLKIVNNRDYAVFVEANHAWAGKPSYSIPTEIWTLFLQLVEPAPGIETLYLTGGAEVTLVFDRPHQTTNLEVHARRGFGALIGYTLFELLEAAGADLPIGGGRTLGVEAIQCYINVTTSTWGSIAAAANMSADDMLSAAGGFVGCLKGIVDRALKDPTLDPSTISKLSAVRNLILGYQVAKYAQVAADLAINDRPGTEADLVDVSVLLKADPDRVVSSQGWNDLEHRSDYIEFHLRYPTVGVPALDSYIAAHANTEFDQWVASAKDLVLEEFLDANHSAIRELWLVPQFISDDFVTLVLTGFVTYGGVGWDPNEALVVTSHGIRHLADDLSDAASDDLWAAGVEALTESGELDGLDPQWCRFTFGISHSGDVLAHVVPDSCSGSAFSSPTVPLAWSRVRHWLPSESPAVRVADGELRSLPWRPIGPDGRVRTLVLEADGLGTGLAFGSPSESVIGTLWWMLGPPSFDRTRESEHARPTTTGFAYGEDEDWPDYWFRYPKHREVCWASSAMTLCTRHGATADDWTFANWSVSGPRSGLFGAPSPLDAATQRGVTVGTPVRDLVAVYPDVTYGWSEGGTVVFGLPGWNMGPYGYLSTFEMDQTGDASRAVRPTDVVENLGAGDHISFPCC